MGAPQWGLVGELHDLIERRDPRFSLLAPLEGVDAALDRVEAAVRTSMWNMQRHASITTLRGNDALNAIALISGVDA